MTIQRKLACIALIATGFSFFGPVTVCNAAGETLVESGVSRLVDGLPAVDDETLLWTTTPECREGGMPGDEVSPALISRASLSIATPRSIFSFNPERPIGVCNPYRLLSNVVPFGKDLYFVDNQGPDGHAAVQRLARDANPGDVPHLFADLETGGVGAVNRASVVVFENSVYVLLGDESRDYIHRYARDTGVLIDRHVEFLSDPGTLANLTYDGRFLYWTGNGALRRLDTITGGLVTVFNGPIETLYTYGYELDCSGPFECVDVSRILFSQGNSLYAGETISGRTELLYSSTVSRARITGITRDFFYYYFIEFDPIGLVGFEERIYRLEVGRIRPELIYGPIGFGLHEGLRTDATWLYFSERARGSLLRLPLDEAAIPVHDLRARRIEVTQGLQDAAQNVRLIEDKRTIVRFYVRSGLPEFVYGVTASLSGTNDLGALGVLEPVNSGGKLITVRPDPSRTRLDDSFQFVLPRHWTSNGRLTLTATVNPARRILEDTSGNNSSTLAVDFTDSPRLQVLYYNFSYDLGGMRRTPSATDVAESRRFMRRLYPLAEPGRFFSFPGLQTAVLEVVDNELADQVERTDPDCVKRYEKNPENLNFCASDYVHARMAMRRNGSLIGAGTVSYGNIAQTPPPMGKEYFTRGYAVGQLASGPSTDRNYAAHEVGHTLGRQHPSVGNKCGHTASDPNYPYAGSSISPTGAEGRETRFAGLDFNDQLPGTMTYLDSDFYFDTMSYCRQNWISDYTFEGLYQYLVSDERPRNARTVARTPMLGDWLMVYGTVMPEEDGGGFVLVQRTTSVMDATPLEIGGFTLQMRNRAGGVISSFPFAPEAVDEAPGVFVFDLTVAFVPGTAELRVIEDSSGMVLATQPVSANAPQISDVQLVGATNPVDGLTTIAWSASDLDGGEMRFDIYARRNADVDYRPIHLGIRGQSVELDTSTLGGGTNVLRVVASDGVNTAYAESAGFTVPARAPRIVITGPVDGFHSDWGQLVTFEAEVDDVQDEFVEQVRWSSNKIGEIGTGRMVQTDQLGVGENIVTVTATNSLGASATATVKVYVGDVLAPRGPTLSVAPQVVAWHIAADDMITHAAALTVDNQGGGTLEFSVTSNQIWLQVDSSMLISTSVAPRTFAITADTTTLPTGVTSHATLTFTNLADPDDVVTVPVEVSRGNVFDHAVETQIVCNGDCNGDGSVTVDELIRAVNIALGLLPIGDCNAIDTDGNGLATVDELVRAVGTALQGC